MTIEERFNQTDFAQFSKIKDSLLLKLKLRRRAINEEMSLEELDEVAAAGTAFNPDDKKKFPAETGIFLFIERRGQFRRFFVKIITFNG